ncbi:hypothetical protein LLEC1_04036, partial [Akanthomyces lecanii]
PARYWARDGFFLSTDKTFLDPFVVNEIFDTDLMWWNDPLDIDQMRKMLSNCMTLAIYSRELGALGFDEGPSAGLVVLEMPGNGVKDVPEDH